MYFAQAATPSTKPGRRGSGPKPACQIYRYFLPASSPTLNLIEPVGGVIKHHDLPERTDASLADLETAVDRAFARSEDRHYVAATQRLQPGLPA